MVVEPLGYKTKLLHIRVDLYYGLLVGQCQM